MVQITWVFLLVFHGNYSPIYIIQPVVKPVVEPVVNRFDKRLYRVYSRLSNRLSYPSDNRFDNRLYRVHGVYEFNDILVKNCQLYLCFVFYAAVSSV